MTDFNLFTLACIADDIVVKEFGQFSYFDPKSKTYATELKHINRFVQFVMLHVTIILDLCSWEHCQLYWSIGSHILSYSRHCLLNIMSHNHCYMIIKLKVCHMISCDITWRHFSTRIFKWYYWSTCFIRGVCPQAITLF